MTAYLPGRISASSVAMLPIVVFMLAALAGAGQFAPKTAAFPPARDASKGLAVERASAPAFLVVLRDGTVSGPLQAFSADGSLVVGGKKIESKEWAELAALGRKSPPPARPPFLQLSNGDRLPIVLRPRPIQSDGRMVVMFDPALLRMIANVEESPAETKSKSPAPSAAPVAITTSVFGPYAEMLALRTPQGVEDSDRFWQEFSVTRRSADVVLMANGDRVEGDVQSLTSEQGCTVKSPARVLTVAWPDLAVVPSRSVRLSRIRSKARYSQVVLASGARLSLTKLVYDAETSTFRGRSFVGATLEFAAQDVAAIRVVNGPVDYLSDFSPVDVVHVPLWGSEQPALETPATADKLSRLAGETPDKSVTMPGGSRVRFSLAGKYKIFDARVGIDASARPLGRVRLAIEVDGKRRDLTSAGDLNSDRAPIEVRQDVVGARELTLIVDYGRLGSVQSQAVWAGVRLWK